MFAQFIWYGSYTSGQLAMQTFQDERSGKFCFKESALDKTSSSFDNRSLSSVNSTNPFKNAKAGSGKGQKLNAVPSAKTLTNGVKSSFAQSEMSMIKWSHLNSENSSTNFACLSTNSRHDCGCVQINDSGIYMISFIQFLGGSSKKKPCI